MNYTLDITGARTLPEINGQKDVLAKINWTITFERGGFTSIGAGETVLDAPQAETFMPLANISKDQIAAWVIAKEGGDAFVAMLSEIHGKVLDSKILDAQSQPAALPFIVAPVAPQMRQTVYNLEAQG